VFYSLTVIETVSKISVNEV